MRSTFDSTLEIFQERSYQYLNNSERILETTRNATDLCIVDGTNFCRSHCHDYKLDYAGFQSFGLTERCTVSPSLSWD